MDFSFEEVGPMKLLSYERFVFLFALLLWAGSLSLSAQDPMQAPEGIPPESDYMYGKHLEQVEGIMKVSDLAARAGQLETFMKKLDPKSKILQYFESFFTQTVDEYRKAGKTAEAQALVSKMQQLFPNSVTTMAHAVHQAFSSQNYAKAIELGEKLNASNPNQQTTMILAQSYMATNNGPKALEHSLKAVEAVGPKDGVTFVVWLAQYYAGQRDIAKSAEYYNLLLKNYPQGAPSGWDPAQWTNLKASAYTMRATDAYVKKDYASAIQSYNETLKQTPQNDAAYLYLGLSHWKLQQLDEAMSAFARAVVIGKTHTAKAREYLEQIYKPRNNNSLEGLDALLEQARAALN
jgi:tetratricopeptide (TPR) repeat protein